MDRAGMGNVIQLGTGFVNLLVGTLHGTSLLVGDSKHNEDRNRWQQRVGVGSPRERIMLNKFGRLQLSLLLLALTPQASAQFAHTDHKQIVDAAGKPLLIRATNLGNWLVPEGYMWLFQGGPQSPSEIRALVLELLDLRVGGIRQKYARTTSRVRTRAPASGWVQRHSSSLHYSLFESDDAEGFKLQSADRLSRAENLYVVLDLHAAPGGQTGTEHR
jgi:hypothetical protein